VDQELVVKVIQVEQVIHQLYLNLIKVAAEVVLAVLVETLDQQEFKVV
jgi:hypothetical protein